MEQYHQRLYLMRILWKTAYGFQIYYFIFLKMFKNILLKTSMKTLNKSVDPYETCFEMFIWFQEASSICETPRNPFSKETVPD
jgi:hypothetical protein